MALESNISSENLWNQVDDFILNSTQSSEGIDYEAILKSSLAAGLPAIQVSAAQGKLLNLLVKSTGAKRILEMGTLGGYSTIWMASALPADGNLVTLEVNRENARVAQNHFEMVGLASKIELKLGQALELLPQLLKNGPFDFTFIDADKANTLSYFQWALKLSRSGSLIVVDNVVRGGSLIQKAEGILKESESPSNLATQGMIQFLNHLKSCREVEATVIQTVGHKGYDGFCMARVN
jgi:predicted O-methyltransferase YrrM